MASFFSSGAKISLKKQLDAIFTENNFSHISYYLVQNIISFKFFWQYVKKNYVLAIQLQ